MLTERWVRLYTVGLPDDLRSARREEIASDLFEQYADSPAGRTWPVRWAVVGRTVRGTVDDLVWRREVARGMASTTSMRAALTQTWWAPFAGLVLLFDIGFAAAVLADENSTMPGRVVGPAVVLLAATALAIGLWVRVAGAGERRPRYLPYAGAAVVAVFTAVATIGGGVLLVLAAVTLVALLAMVVRGSVRSSGVADGLILLGTLPALAMFWFVIPALLALAVIVGVLTSRTRAVPVAA